MKFISNTLQVSHIGIAPINKKLNPYHATLYFIQLFSVLIIKQITDFVLVTPNL